MLLLLHEGALHRTFGNARIMREQLEHLITLQRRDNIIVRVVPSDAATGPATGTPFSLYELADGSPYVLVETEGVGLFITEPPNVKPFMERCQMLQSCALDENSSDALIRKIAEGLAND